MAQAMLSMSTGGAGTAFGGQISPLFIQKTPNPRQTWSYKGWGGTNTAHVGPQPPQGHRRMPVLPTKSNCYPGIGAGDGISPGIQGLGSAGEAHWGCVSEAAVSEPA